MNVNTLNLEPTEPVACFFEGTTALSAGMGVCLNADYGTATAADGSRCNRVELPDSTNHRNFFGVVARDYTANANGQWILVYRPGSVCNVLVDGSVTIGAVCGLLANDAQSLTTGSTIGKWSASYNNGRGLGSVEILQTRTGAGVTQARILMGDAVGHVEVFTGAAPASPNQVVVSPFGTSVLTNSADTSTNNWLLGNGTFIGQRKRIVFASIATANKIDFGAATLASIAGAANRYASAATNGNYIIAEWTGTHWKIIMMSPSGITLS